MNKKFMFVIMTLIIVASIVFSPAVVPAAPNRAVHGEKLAATAPVANFTGDPTSGSAPLQVGFSDGSTGNPTGWAWYFGDEEFDEPWTQMTSTADWTKRYDHTSVVLPDGSIVLMGGYDGSFRNDVWRSEDQVTTWTQLTADAPWTGRSGHDSVVFPDGNIVLMGGKDGEDSYRNDVWLSTNKGANWTKMPETPEWTPRYRHTSVVLPDGSIVLMGGFDGSRRNDVWHSPDQGATWTQVSAGCTVDGKIWPRQPGFTRWKHRVDGG